MALIKVIEGGFEETLQKKEELENKRFLCWIHYYQLLLRAYLDNDKLINDISFCKKIIFAFVKAVRYVPAKEMESWALMLIHYSGINERFLARFTIEDFVNAFPITKDYDGAKYMSKDYFSTMELLSAFDKHALIKDCNVYSDMDIKEDEYIDCFFSAYWNQDIISYNVRMFMLVDVLRRREGKKDLMLEFVEKVNKESDHKIHTYSFFDDKHLVSDDGKKVISVVKNKRRNKAIRVVK